MQYNFVTSAVDKCTPVRYNVFKFLMEVLAMKTSSKSYHFSCCSTAVANASARKVEYVDTVPVAVSILILHHTGI